MKKLNIQGFIQFKSPKFKIVFFSLVLLLLTILLVTFINRTTFSLYRFATDLSFSFDLNKWRLSPNSSLGGSILTSEDSATSILITSARVENKELSLAEIVDQRVEVLRKDNISINVTPISFNGIDFYRIEYRDPGDENIISDQKNITFATLDEDIYITFQIFYSNEESLRDVLAIFSTLKKN